jgi:hypothetical protein
MSSPYLPATARAAGLILLATLACGCGGEKVETPAAQRRAAEAARQQSTPTETAAATTTRGGDLAIAGVVFTAPAGWDNLGPREMRKAQYRLAPVAGDSEPGEVNVFYFGGGQGGDVEANLQRWSGQMSETSAAPARSTFDVGGMAAHLITVEGSYSGGMGGPMGGGGAAKPGYRLVGVVLEAPQGNVFFKLTGPVATARAMESELMTMVRGARTTG